MLTNLGMEDVIGIIPEEYKPKKDVEEPKLCDWNCFIYGFLLGIVPMLIYVIYLQIYGN